MASKVFNDTGEGSKISWLKISQRDLVLQGNPPITWLGQNVYLRLAVNDSFTTVYDYATIPIRISLMYSLQLFG